MGARARALHDRCKISRTRGYGTPRPLDFRKILRLCRYYAPFFAHYARLCSHARRYQLCSILCPHNVRLPSDRSAHQWVGLRSYSFRRVIAFCVAVHVAFSRERISVIEQCKLELYRAGVELVKTSVEGRLKFWERDRCLIWEKRLTVGRRTSELFHDHFSLATGFLVLAYVLCILL